MSKVNEVLEIVKGLTVLELAELIKKFEEEFGVSAQASMVMPVTSTIGPAAIPAVEEEEQTEFDVMLTAVGEKKINVIKVVREITSLGLKEAKELVDNAPRPIKEKVNKDEAQAIKAKVEEQGATVEIK
ncbi:MAG TPA: 50S ribosomal protein L7/L12 [Desulfotomaculum sp.]|nr:50S ribosomal protein L7/L12 [Desulfotomaculum sp.]HCJ78545.1 50S ribosomal protein L7/L12 [Desulfotomaculum sp.]